MTIALLLLAAVSGQDIPGTSPLDLNTLNRATTSSQIDNNVLDDVTRTDRRRARDRGRAPARARSGYSAAPADPVLRARYCQRSTPIYRRLGRPIDPACR